MITANYSPFFHQVRFEIPGAEKPTYEFDKAVSLDDAKRKMYFRIRRYIYEKLSSWLRQREHAIIPYDKAENYAEKVAAIHVLLLQLDNYQKTSYWNLCALVCRQLDKLQLLAPNQSSRHYKYYQREILPIINHCIEMKGSAE